MIAYLQLNQLEHSARDLGMIVWSSWTKSMGFTTHFILVGVPVFLLILRERIEDLGGAIRPTELRVGR